ncbi:hypothetical protein MTO96_040853, partial [Rhipicephalus appendiculatus]
MVATSLKDKKYFKVLMPSQNLDFNGESFFVADVTNETIRKCSRRASFHVPGDDSENSDECNEAIAGVAEVWSELSKFPEAVDGSTVDEFVSADDDVATTGELENEDYIADIVPSTSESGHNDQSNDDPLPTSSE